MWYLGKISVFVMKDANGGEDSPVSLSTYMITVVFT